MWHEVHGFGMPYLSVMEGDMKLNVWLRTATSAIVVAICGMWQATHLFPALLAP